MKPIKVAIADDEPLARERVRSMLEGRERYTIVAECHDGVEAVAAHLAQLGMTALHIGCLAANAPARRFYESLGGGVVIERLFDEEGIMLPEVVYGWPDIGVLVAMERGEPDETQ